MQLPLKEFYKYSPRQFQNYATGYFESKEQTIKENLYNTRLVAYWSAVGFLKKGTKPEQLISFPWEKETESESLMPTEEEIQASIDFWKKIDKKRANGKTDS